MANNQDGEFFRIVEGLDIPSPEFDTNRFDSFEEQDFIETYNAKEKHLYHDYEDKVVESHIDGKVAYFEPIAFSTYGPICSLYTGGKQGDKVVVFGSLFKSAKLELNGLPMELVGAIPSMAIDERQVVKNIYGMPFIFTPYGFVQGSNLCYAHVTKVDELKNRRPVNRLKQGHVYGEFTLVDAFSPTSEDLYAISHTIYIEDEPSDRINLLKRSHT